MRLQTNRAALLTLAVIILGGYPTFHQAPWAPDIRAARAAAPADPPAVVYLPLVVNNFDPTYVNPFGVIMYEGVSDAAGLPQMKAAGSHWATVKLGWAQVEPTPPVAGVHTYAWGSFDTQAHNAQVAGLNLFVLVTGNPAWAAQYPGGPVTDTTQLVSFVSAAAERYDGDGISDAPGDPVINYWSFYGEPDNGQESRAPGGKGWWGNNPAGYAAILAQVSPAIHAANPDAKVTTGGLAYDWFTTDSLPGPFVRTFLTNTLSALNGYPGGVQRYLDAVAFHYYPINTQRWPTIIDKALEIKGIMSRNGAGALPMMVPEMGFWSDPGLDSSEAIQAQTLVQMYVRGLSAGIQQMSWYAVFDYSSTGTGFETMGLFRHGNLSDPKPAYTAYSVMTSELNQFHYDHAVVVPGVEGYTFRRGTATFKTVLWAKAAPAQAVFSQACVRRVDLLGGAQQVVDGSPGDMDGPSNGTVTLTLGVHAPVYVGPCA